MEKYSRNLSILTSDKKVIGRKIEFNDILILNVELRHRAFFPN